MFEKTVRYMREHSKGVGLDVADDEWGLDYRFRAYGIELFSD
jgi:hypothetical protein